MQDTAALLAKKAYEAMHRAYAPYSKFSVGACLQTEDGTLFKGSNIENASYGLTVCAERVAVFSMAAAGHRKIKAIAIAGSTDNACYPCGACRQVLREFATPNILIYMCNRNGDILKTASLEEILPNSFGPEFLE